jgi:hypothetical protein
MLFIFFSPSLDWTSSLHVALRTFYSNQSLARCTEGESQRRFPGQFSTGELPVSEARSIAINFSNFLK